MLGGQRFTDAAHTELHEPMVWCEFLYTKTNAVANADESVCGSVCAFEYAPFCCCIFTQIAVVLRRSTGWFKSICICKLYTRHAVCPSWFAVFPVAYI